MLLNIFDIGLISTVGCQGCRESSTALPKGCQGFRESLTALPKGCQGCRESLTALPEGASVYIKRVLTTLSPFINFDILTSLA